MRDAWKNLPVMGAGLGLVAVSALGLAYWSNVQDREHYLQSRNFRLLAVLARQTEQLVENRGRVFREAVAVTLPAMKPNGQWTAWRGRQRRAFRASQRDPTAIEELAGGEARVAATNTDLGEMARELPGYSTRVTGDGLSLRFDWIAPQEEDAAVSVRVPAAEVLRGIFDPKVEQGAFDTVLLADPKGSIVYAAGRRASEIRATSIAALLPSTAPGPVRRQQNSVADTVDEERVQIAGVEYRLFMQPCCRTGGASPGTGGFVVGGLVESQALLEASLAISPVLVLVGAVFVLGLLVGWVFLKVALIGPQQSVTRLDVLQLGASGIFGLALATILLLTTATYARLSADVDGQLERLADRLDERLAGEVKAAARQLTGMTGALRDDACVDTAAAEAGNRSLPDPCRLITDRWSAGADLPAKDYPAFTAFALLDATGFQGVKAAFLPTTQRRIAVADRDYFLRARSGDGLWKIEACEEGCILESHWSWTTGKPQVVLSMPTGIDAYPVAALSLPMDPVLKPVLPPGFEFAVIDQAGQVHFHSDKQRNVHENLLLETDQNRRLRSLVTTHGAGAVNTSYWGRPYRAYVRPTLVPGWSIVALHAKQPTRSLVLEWSAVALLMQSGYTLLWIVLTLVLMASSASWLWPDPLRRPWYPALAIVYGASLAAWLIMAALVDTATTVWTGLLLPPALWALTCAVLIARPKDKDQPRAWSDLCRDYRLAGALMLTITAAVPAASFFALSSSLHLEAYLKDQQIALAHQVHEATKCADPLGRVPEGLKDVRYDDVFYRSEVTCAEAATIDPTPPRVRRQVHRKFEDYVPYFTSASIALRELMHERSDDDAWASSRSEPGRLSVSVRVREPRYRLAVSSPVLPTLGVRSIGDDPRLVWTAALALLALSAVGLSAFWMIGYLLRRVVLADVVEPVRANGHILTSPGQHALVLCDQPAAKAAELKQAQDVIVPLMPVVTAPNVVNEWRKARREVSDASPMQRIVIPDLDDKPDDVASMRRRLELIEELMGEPDQTVLLLSRRSKKSLASCVRDSWKWSHETERWSKLLARLAVIDTRQPKDPGPQSGAAKRAAWWRELSAIVRDRVDAIQAGRRKSDAPGFQPDGQSADTSAPKVPATPPDWRARLLDVEADGYPPIKPFCQDLKYSPAFTSGLLTDDQILEELEERVVAIYCSLWLSCDEDERIVLEHVALYGLVSAASRRVVRRLLARGLLRKDPALRLMNRSFRRFVLETERRQEVVALERQAGPSLWDQLRVPIGMAAIIAAAFLAATQREAFNATLTMAAGVTTAVPTLVKLTTLLTQLGTKATVGEQKGNA
jgi:hypothetical protein